MGASGVNRNAIVGALSVTGAVTASTLKSPSNFAAIAEAQGGGYLLLEQSTAQQTAPSAGFIRLYTRPGTTGVKLVALGNGGTEFTVLDNIV